MLYWTDERKRRTLVGCSPDPPPALLLVALSALLFGSVGVLAREAYAAGFAAGGLLALRFGFSALIFAAAHAIHAGRSSGAARLRLDRSAVRGALFGAAITSLQVAFLFAAFARAAGRDRGRVALHLPRDRHGDLERATRRVPRPRAAATLIVSLSGVALVVLAAAQGGGSALGCAFALGSGLLYAINIVLASRLLRTDSALEARNVAAGRHGDRLRRLVPPPRSRSPRRHDCGLGVARAAGDPRHRAADRSPLRRPQARRADRRRDDLDARTGRRRRVRRAAARRAPQPAADSRRRPGAAREHRLRNVERGRWPFREGTSDVKGGTGTVQTITC